MHYGSGSGTGYGSGSIMKCNKKSQKREADFLGNYREKDLKQKHRYR
jgi:hypothetical protein